MVPVRLTIFGTPSGTGATIGVGMNEPIFLGWSYQHVVSGRPALLGCPLDMTATYRAGTGEAPRAIRLASDSVETYSPLLDRDLESSPFSDLGDLDFSDDDLEGALNEIEDRVRGILRDGGIPLCLGGEHTITLPIVKALKSVEPDFVVVQLDAHADLRDSYLQSRINHATVMRRVVEELSPARLIQLGVRAGTREEFSWMRDNGTMLPWRAGHESRLLDRIGSLPVYLSIDLDVLDPGCLPGTGNPEAGGWFYHDLERLVTVIESVTLLGADVVELNPSLDLSQVGTITAAKIVRELLLILSGDRADPHTSEFHRAR